MNRFAESNELKVAFPEKSLPVQIPTRSKDDWIKINLSLPEVNWSEALRVQQMLFLKDGIHFFASLGSLTAGNLPAKPETALDKWIEKLTRRDAGNDWEVRIGRQTFASTLQQTISELLKKTDKIGIQGLGQKGHFYETAGGMLGHGFYLELDDPKRAKGSVQLSDFAVVAGDDSCWNVTTKLSVNAEAQIKGHIKPMTIGGRNIGGGVGIPTTKTNIAPLNVSGSLRVCVETPAGKPPELGLSLLSPDRVEVEARAKLEAGIGWVNIPKIAVHVPTGVLQRVPFPNAIATKAHISWQNEQLLMAIEVPSYSVTSDATTTTLSGQLNVKLDAHPPTRSATTGAK